MALTLACPLRGGCVIVPGAGARFGHVAALGGRIHTGLDLEAPYGTPILAPAPGIVSRTWIEGGGGRMIELQHQSFATRYAHLSRLAQFGRDAIRVGSHVNVGDVIAYSGASGLVTGPHLHFEVLIGGTFVDPEPLLFGGKVIAGSSKPNPVDKGADGNCPPGYNTVWSDLSERCWLTGADGKPIIPAGTPAFGPVGPNAVDWLGAVVPIAVNLGVVLLVLVLAFAGVRQALGASAA